MRRIIKRLFKRDSLGNVQLESEQEVVDDEQGTIAETTVSTFAVCRSCSCPLESLKDIGACDRCGSPCCESCAVPCAVCSRRLCAQCRRGFAEKQLTVCPECLSALSERLQHHDELLREKVAFERLLAVHREQMRLVQYGLFHSYPTGDLLEQVAELRLMKKLNKLERAMVDHEQRR